MKNSGSVIWVVLILLATGATSVSAFGIERNSPYYHLPASRAAVQHRLRNESTNAAFAEEPGWQQVNSNGFGDLNTGAISALAVFDNRLFAGTSNAVDGARIYQSQSGTMWTPVTQPGFGISHDIRPPSILDLTVFHERLYASTGRGDGPGQIWRSLDGVNWAPMVIAGFNDPDITDVTALVEYNGTIYAGATNLISGAQIWRSFTGDSNSWEKVAPGTPGTSAATVTEMAEFNGALYASIETDGPAQIWRSYGSTWTVVEENGFADPPATSTGGMAGFAGYLYVGAGNASEGAQLWRTNNGTNWTQVIPTDFGSPDNQTVETVYVWQSQIYISVKNAITGIELWRSPDGLKWEQVNQDGFGDRKNVSANSGHSAAAFLGDFYVGTENIVDGGELWRLQITRQFLYLPLALK